jgi:hypothetical protein
VRAGVVALAVAQVLTFSDVDLDPGGTGDLEAVDIGSSRNPGIPT